MSRVPNVFSSDFEEQSEQEGFRCRGTSVVARRRAASGSARASTRFHPGEATSPYHYHLANEELLIVLRGRPHLRTPDGWRQLDEGEVVAFPLGERGAHQLANRTDEDVRVS